MIVPRLREIRLERGLTQNGLSEVSGVSPATIFRAEQGRAIGSTRGRRLAQALGVETRDLLGEQRQITLVLNEDQADWLSACLGMVMQISRHWDNRTTSDTANEVWAMLSAARLK